MESPAPIPPAPRRRAPARPRTRAATAAAVDVAASTTATLAPARGPTLELLAYAVTTALALALRLWHLGEQPLAPDEAARALAAIRFDVAPPPEIGAFLRNGSALAMGLLGATDFSARLLPALFGGLVPLAAMLLRPLLGRTVAVLAALLLTLSPVLVDQARVVGNGAIAATLGLAVFALALRLVDAPREGDAAGPRGGDARLLAVALASLLVAGPPGVATLALFGALWLIWWAVDRRAEPVVALAAKAAAVADTATAAEVRRIGPFALPDAEWRRAGALFLATLLFLATGAMTNPLGPGETIGDAAGAWLGGFTISAGWPISTSAFLFFGYEPLLVVGGFAGAILSWRRADAVGQLLSLWAAIGIALATLRAGRRPEDAVLWVVPLAVLTAIAAATLIGRLVELRGWRQVGTGIGMAIVLLGLQLIAATHITTPNPFVDDVVAAIPMIAFALLAVALYQWMGSRRATATLAAFGLLALLGFSIHAAWNVAYFSGSNTAEITRRVQTSPDVRNLAEDLDEVLDVLVVNRKPTTLSVARRFDPPLGWYLRDFPGATFERGVTGSPSVAVIPLEEKPPSGSYAGQRYMIAIEGWPSWDNWRELLRWWLYREGKPPTALNANVYVKAQ